MPTERQNGATTTDEFQTALAQASALLGHAASAGLFPEEGATAGSVVIPDIVAAQEAARTSAVPPQVATAFWIAYSRLSRLSAPVSAASFTASRNVPMIGMKLRATIVVVLVIISSVFLFMSNATLNETQELVDQQNAAGLKLRADIQLLRDSLQQSGSGAAQGSSIIAERVFDETIEFSRKSASLLQSAIRLHASFTPWWFDLSRKDVTFNANNTNGMQHLNVSPQLSGIEAIEKEAVYQIEAYQYIRDYALSLCKIDSLIYTGLSTYLLPTVYALLGAFLYGFRMYSWLIRRNRFLPSAAHSARYFIAAIAGLVIGLFGSLLPKGLSIPPLAVAFLLGYAVEAFFSRLDDLIHRFRTADARAGPLPDPSASPAMQAAE